jgi:hypothetical protein
MIFGLKLGAENKKATYFLGGLLVLLGYFVYSNLLTGPSAPSSAPRTSAPAAAGDPSSLIAPPVAPAVVPRPQAQRVGSGDFHPVLRSKRPEERIDPMTVDPTLHLELLKKLDDAATDTGGRNLFQFGQPPAPPPTPEQLALLKHPEPVVKPLPPPPAAPTGPPQPPPPPLIPIKYYGLSTQRASGKKIAFFLDGDNILMAGEGEMLQKRYRVVRINVSSVVVEDTQLKREQSLPLTGEPTAAQQGENPVVAGPSPAEPRGTITDELRRTRPGGFGAEGQPETGRPQPGGGRRGAVGPGGPGGNQ